jgi:hypothetical protein
VGGKKDVGDKGQEEAGRGEGEKREKEEERGAGVAGVIADDAGEMSQEGELNVLGKNVWVERGEKEEDEKGVEEERKGEERGKAGARVREEDDTEEGKKA